MPRSYLPLFIMLLGWCCLGAAPQANPGCAPGAEVPSFFVREVVGHRPNLAICLVCRYGERPVALVCVRNLNAEVAQLIERVDRAVDAGRGVGLRGFAVFTNGDFADLQPRLANLTRERKTSLPLVLPIERGGPSTMQLPREADVTVLLYRDKTVAQRFTFAPDELDKDNIDRVIAAIEQLPKS